MQFIKLALLSIVFLFFVICCISFFIPSHIRISRTIRIDNTKETVMEQLKDPVKWKNWYPGADSAKLFYVGGNIKGIILNDDTGQSIITDSMDENEITAIYKGNSGKNKVASTWRIFPEVNSSHISVQWYMDFHLRWYPWEKFSSLLYEKTYGPQMEQGLNNLKKLLESK